MVPAWLVAIFWVVVISGAALTILMFGALVAHVINGGLESPPSPQRMRRMKEEYIRDQVSIAIAYCSNELARQGGHGGQILVQRLREKIEPDSREVFDAILAELKSHFRRKGWVVTAINDGLWSFSPTGN